MNEKLKAFSDFLGENEEIKKALIEKLSDVKEDRQKAAETVIAFAKEQGFELSADDLQPKSGGLDDSDVEAIAGGVVCVFVGTSRDIDCGVCMIVGAGTSGNKTKCVCIFGGGG